MTRRLQRIDELTAPPVIGKRYLVPHVLYPWLHHGEHQPRLWPVIGPKHDDDKHLQFPWQHYHVDGRFLNAREWALAGKYIAESYAIPPAFVTGPETTIAGVPLQRVKDHRDHSVIPHPEPVYRPRVCRRHVPYVSLVTRAESPFLRLWAAFEGKPCSRAGGVMICPHKGAPLSGIAPDADGNITCPLHGLRFTPDGQAVSRGAA